MEIKKATEFDDSIKEKISELFVDAFWELSLVFLRKDKDLVKKALVHSVNCEYIRVLLIDDEVAGAVACVPNGVVATQTDRKELVKHLGFLMGNIFHFIRGKIIGLNKFPFKLDDKTGIIEILATNEKYRGKGVGTALMRHVVEVYDYERFVLEVVDINDAAIKLYEKLGYREVMRKKSPFRNSPHKYSIYMKYTRDKEN